VPVGFVFILRKELRENVAARTVRSGPRRAVFARRPSLVVVDNLGASCLSASASRH
jgi:hypothetical protein